MQILCAFEMSGTVHLVSRHHIAEALNLHQRHCVNLRSCGQCEARIEYDQQNHYLLCHGHAWNTSVQLVCSTRHVGFWRVIVQRSSCEHSGQFARFEVFTWCC